MSISLSKDAQLHIEEWQSWFTPPKGTWPRGISPTRIKAPQAKTFINALISQCAGDIENIAKAHFAWRCEDDIEFTNAMPAISGPLTRMAKDLADRLMPGPVERFLDRLLEFYSQDAYGYFLRSRFRDDVIDSYYANKEDLVALDVPLDLLPSPHHDEIDLDTLEKAYKKMSAEIEKCEPADLKELLLKAKSDVLGNERQLFRTYQFVVLAVEPEVKENLGKAIRRPLKFHDHVMSYFVKFLRTCRKPKSSQD